VNKHKQPAQPQQKDKNPKKLAISANFFVWLSFVTLGGCQVVVMFPRGDGGG
jgi:hypothetical protein